MDNEVDINYGVDFERALERLHFAAGKILEQHRKAKRSNNREEEIERLGKAYIDT